MTSRVAATLINSLGFIQLHLFKGGSALSFFQRKSPREILTPGQVGLVHNSPLWVSTSPLATRLMILASIWCRWPQRFFILEEELTARHDFLSLLFFYSFFFYCHFFLPHFLIISLTPNPSAFLLCNFHSPVYYTDCVCQPHYVI